MTYWIRGDRSTVTDGKLAEISSISWIFIIFNPPMKKLSSFCFQGPCYKKFLLVVFTYTCIATVSKWMKGGGLLNFGFLQWRRSSEIIREVISFLVKLKQHRLCWFACIEKLCVSPKAREILNILKNQNFLNKHCPL